MRCWGRHARGAGTLARRGNGDPGSSNRRSYSLRANPVILVVRTLRRGAFGSFLPGCHEPALQKTLYTTDTSQTDNQTFSLLKTPADLPHLRRY